MEKTYVRRIGMSNSGKKLRKLEQQLKNLQQKGNTEATLQLSEEQATFVKEELKLPISVILYEIRTKQIENVTSTAGLLQEVHRAYKRGQETIRKAIRGKDFGTLETAGVEFRPVRYRIILSAAKC